MLREAIVRVLAATGAVAGEVVEPSATRRGGGLVEPRREQAGAVRQKIELLVATAEPVYGILIVVEIENGRAACEPEQREPADEAARPANARGVCSAEAPVALTPHHPSRHSHDHRAPRTTTPPTPGPSHGVISTEPTAGAAGSPLGAVSSKVAPTANTPRPAMPSHCPISA